jgi:hypothetical protein
MQFFRGNLSASDFLSGADQPAFFALHRRLVIDALEDSDIIICFSSVVNESVLFQPST